VQTGLARPGTCPLKLFAQAFIACHEIVKDENRVRRQMFRFFPIHASTTWARQASFQRRFAASS